MKDALGYEGSNVVVTGTASGMGAQTARILTELGARVTALDIKDTEVEVDRRITVDLRDPAAIDEATAQIDGPIDSLFSCAGLPGPPFSEIDTIVVNFVGARHLIESLVPKMAQPSSIGVISSAAGLGWEEHVPVLMELFGEQSFEGAKAWLEANEETWGYSGYLWSKYALDAWVGWRGADLIADGIRLNATNPGPTETPMMPAFHDLAGKELIETAIGPIDRYSTAEEQGWPLVLLNSPRMSYVSGTILWTDGGFQGACATGKHGGIG